MQNKGGDFQEFGKACDLLPLITWDSKDLFRLWGVGYGNLASVKGRCSSKATNSTKVYLLK